MWTDSRRRVAHCCPRNREPQPLGFAQFAVYFAGLNGGPLALAEPTVAPRRDGQNQPLAEERPSTWGSRCVAVTIRRFADGEIFVKIDDNVRGRDVFIIQPTTRRRRTTWSCCS